MGNQATEASTTPNGPSSPSKRLQQAQDKPDWELSAQLAEKRLAQDWHDTEGLRMKEVADAAKSLWKDRGTRYESCRFENFYVANEAQQLVVDRLRSHQFHQGLILTGPSGTGKDHLMAALMHGALASGSIVKWTSGLGLFRRLRDAIDEHRSETALLRGYVKPDILAISDPTWERKPLTDWQQQRLGEIVDDRWNNCRPIWVTINVEKRADAEKMLGAALVDRLRDGALSLACNWESYRRSVGTHELTGPDRRKPTGV